MPPDVYPEASSPSPPGAGERSNGSASGIGESPADSLRMAWIKFIELGEYARYFLAAKVDRLKLTIRQLVVLAILAVLGLVAGAGAVVTAIVLTLRGVAGGLAVLCGDRPWLGDLLCGVLVLAGIAIVLRVSLSRFTTTNRKATVNKYESDQRKERINLDQHLPPDSSVGGTGH